MTLAGTASADIFSFTYSNETVTASGYLYATPLGGGRFQITELFGTRNGVDIALLPVNVFGSNDNLLSFPAEPYVTFSGISFVDKDGVDYNIYNDGAYRESLSGYPDGAAVALSFESVPEPSSLLCLGSAILGALGVARRRLQL